jgi:hypothetical protein
VASLSEQAAPAAAPDAPAPSRPPASLVPLAGLPFVAAAFALLIAATASDSVWALNLAHVASGATWTTLDLFVGLVIGPILGRLSLPARAEFSVRFMPAMALLVPTLAVSTLVSGWQLASRYGYLDTAFVNHGWLVASFIVVGVMGVIAIGILEPANVAVLFELRKPQPDGAVVAKLMRRFVFTAGITGLMQVATIVIMTYLRTPL